MVNYTRVFAVFVMLGPTMVAIGQREPSATAAEPTRFSVDFGPTKDRSDGSYDLKIVFLGTVPDPAQVVQVLRKTLEAAVILMPAADIVATPWSGSLSSKEGTKRLALPDGATGLIYRASDKSVQPLSESAPANGAPGDEASVADDAGVQKLCGNVQRERLDLLATVAINSRGGKRSHIVRALRTWCREQGIVLDSSMSKCVSAISKAAHASAPESTETTEVSEESIARGVSAYETAQCAKCHNANGRGGPRGPDLTDNDWLHCDGSVAGIRRVLVKGVPASKLKDPKRTFGMNPATNLLKTDEEIRDLAAYVYSLSRK